MIIIFAFVSLCFLQFFCFTNKCFLKICFLKQMFNVYYRCSHSHLQPPPPKPCTFLHLPKYKIISLEYNGCSLSFLFNLGAMTAPLPICHRSVCMHEYVYSDLAVCKYCSLSQCYFYVGCYSFFYSAFLLKKLTIPQNKIKNKS